MKKPLLQFLINAATVKRRKLDPWKRLEELNCTLIFSEETEYNLKIFGSLPPELNRQALLAQHTWIEAIEEFALEEVDWTSQWSLHGSNFYEGLAHIDLTPYFLNNCKESSIIKLKPGPGFGDLSHPTTRLVLSMMGGVVKDRHIIDLGCGSGILSLAAAAMGASSVCGIDIDLEALKHARDNAKLNHVENRVNFFEPKEFSKTWEKRESYTVLMNMIWIEQCQAWPELAPFYPFIETILTSGILKEQEKKYIEHCQRWNWSLVKKQQEEAWLGFHYKLNLN
jgi:ribosomal protein L11 methyltransferase